MRLSEEIRITNSCNDSNSQFCSIHNRAREHHDAILAQALEEGWSADRRKAEEEKIKHFKLLNYFI